MIPLISSICYGPLGLCQLPRSWWKASLKARGLLADDYPACSPGLDTWLFESLELEPADVQSFIEEYLPDYVQFEAWVLEVVGGAIDDAMVVEWNASIRNRVHTRSHKLAEIYGTIGWEEGVLGPATGANELPNSAVVLNHLEDWHFFRHRDLADGTLAAYANAVIPLISTLDYGPLGVCQLPRTWQKVLLEARGLLNTDYPGCGGGLDGRVLEVLGLDREQTINYLRSQQPDYLAFEDWVFQEFPGNPPETAISEWNAFVRSRVHKDEKQEDIVATLGRENDGTLTSAVILNHLEDWHLAHASLISQ